MEKAGRLNDNMPKPGSKPGKVEEEIVKKTDSGEQKRNADRSCFTTTSIFTPANVGTSLRKEYEEYESENMQLRTEKRTDCDFLLEESSLGNLSSAILQSFSCPITRDVMFDPAESSSRQMFEIVAIGEWSANESKPCLLNETPVHSSCSSIEGWKGRNMIIDAESKFDEVESGLVNPKQLMNLCEEINLHLEWAVLKQDWAILVHVHGEKIHYRTLVILRIFAKYSADEKSDFFIELSHRNLVKPFACCWEDKKQLHVCWIIQEGNLRNHLFKKYPTIEPMSWEKPFKFNTGAAGRLTSLHSLKKLDIYQTFKITKSLLAQTPNNMDARDFTALDIPSVLFQCGKKDMEIKKTPPRAWALRTKDVFEKAFQWWHQQSHPQNTRTMKTNHDLQCNSHHLLLLTSTLLATITLHTALKISGRRSEEGYNPRLNSMFQIETNSNQLFITFNSLAFFLSVALMMRLFSRLPFRPWLLISVFSMIGAYMCIMMDPVKPRMFTS